MVAKVNDRRELAIGQWAVSVAAALDVDLRSALLVGLLFAIAHDDGISPRELLEQLATRDEWNETELDVEQRRRAIKNTRAQFKGARIELLPRRNQG